MEINLFNANIAEIQVRYRNKVKNSERRKITTSKDAEEVLRNIWGIDIELRECFYIILLNRANKVIGYYKLSEGGTTGTVADGKLIFSIALKTLACSVVLAHNHPSGNAQPSDADIKLTRKLRQAGEVLDISVIDHLIITAEGYFSFADEGML